MIKKHSRNKHYWFTIVAANNQVLATSETYTTAAMRDKGIEAVKKVVVDEYERQVKDAKAQLNNMMIRKPPKPSDKEVITGRVRYKPSDTFHIENKKGKIVKR